MTKKNLDVEQLVIKQTKEEVELLIHNLQYIADKYVKEKNNHYFDGDFILTLIGEYVVNTKKIIINMQMIEERLHVSFSFRLDKHKNLHSVHWGDSYWFISDYHCFMQIKNNNNGMILHGIPEM